MSYPVLFLLARKHIILYMHVKHICLHIVNCYILRVVFRVLFIRREKFADHILQLMQYKLRFWEHVNLERKSRCHDNYFEFTADD